MKNQCEECSLQDRCWYVDNNEERGCTEFVFDGLSEDKLRIQKEHNLINVLNANIVKRMASDTY